MSEVSPDPSPYEYLNKSAQIKSIIITFFALAVIAVCLRFTARRLSKAGFWYDDWLIVPATLSAAALCFISALWMTKEGLGYELDERLPESEIKGFTKGIFASEICWTFAIWTVKYSILAFYWRLFSANRRSIRIIIWVLAAVVMVWGIAVILITVLQCVPVYLIWYLMEGDLCSISTAAIYVSSSIPHIITDVVFLGFPVPLIWNLHMHKSRKMMLTAIFAVGGFVNIVSVIRFVYLMALVRANSGLHGSDPTWNYIDVFIWTSVEVNTSIICACLPSLGPIVSYVSKQIHRLRKRKTTHKRGTQLLMDMLPAGRPVSLPVPPLSRKPSWSDGPNPMLDSSAILEVEARNPQAPELDAEAPGPHILEIETLEPVLEMESQRPLAELEGWSRPWPTGRHGMTRP
ncbi:hypothetical protein BDR22DRAFT_934515 [Usnea florida]